MRIQLCLDASVIAQILYDFKLFGEWRKPGELLILNPRLNLLLEGIAFSLLYFFYLIFFSFIEKFKFAASLGNTIKLIPQQTLSDGSSEANSLQ